MPSVMNIPCRAQSSTAHSQSLCSRASWTMAAKGLPIQKQMAVINDAWFAGKYNLKQPSEAAVLKVVRRRKSLRAAGDFKQLARETCQMFGTWPKMASIVSEMERQNFKIHQKALRLTKKRNLYHIKKEELTVNPVNLPDGLGLFKLLD